MSSSGPGPSPFQISKSQILMWTPTTKNYYPRQLGHMKILTIKNMSINLSALIIFYKCFVWCIIVDSKNNLHSSTYPSLNSKFSIINFFYFKQVPIIYHQQPTILVSVLMDRSHSSKLIYWNSWKICQLKYINYSSWRIYNLKPLFSCLLKCKYKNWKD